MTRYSIGVDLGTTNCALAFVATEDQSAESPPAESPSSEVEVLPIRQVTAPSTLEERSALPSFLYLATDGETESAAFDLPWAESRDYAVGEYARGQSAQVPTRAVSAAKSWLSNSRVERHQPILPWDAPEEVGKISPVEASRRYLEHLRAAWDEAHPEHPLAEQEILLTVPASFDANARELTREAALAAGFPKDLTLLEEPQAAVYSWLGSMGDEWRKEMAQGDVLLICDVGGGTTDFTLIRAVDDDGELGLERIAVGNHILVGGDNMDLALAHHARIRFQEQGTDVDAWQSVALWHSCRHAKESLLSSPDAATHKVTIPGRGSKLIGGAVSTELEREEVVRILVDGFFPVCDVDDRPVRSLGSGFQEVGLPFESDPAVTRHLAQFLGNQGKSGDGSIRPTRVLFVGGCLKAEAFQQRLLEVLSSWFEDGDAIQPLQKDPDLDFAVSRGAAYYGLVKSGRGVRIRGGAGHSHYIGVETAGLAVPGMARPLKAICVLPFGMEEGTETDVPGSEVGLVVGEPAEFRFFSSSERQEDEVGRVLDSWSETELVESRPLELTLDAEAGAEGVQIPVRFRSRLTELGMFELWCVGTEAGQEWKLEFSVRDQDD